MKDQLPRRNALKIFLAIPAALGAVFAARPADAKGPKAQFKYQNKPNKGQACAACRFFLPGKNRTANGSCTLVEGSISPKGWCIAFNKK